MNQKIIPVILSGGSGTRLWPISRASRPKQFLHFGSQYSMLQETVLRCRGACFDDRPIMVCGEEQRFMIAGDLQAIGVDADILLEPVSRMTCSAALAGSLQAMHRDKDAFVLVMAADHRIDDAQAFAAAVEQALSAARLGKIVAFGIKPNVPTTGFGYILPGEPIENAGECRKLMRFVEKPPAQEASSLLLEGYLWNSGNLLFRADVFLAEVARLSPGTEAAVTKAFQKRQPDLDFVRLDREEFERAPAISVDHALLEKTDKAAVLPTRYGWSDIGSWEQVWLAAKHDDNGNALEGSVMIASGSNNLVHSAGQLTVLSSVDDLVVVATRDAVLVTKRSESHNVGNLVADLAKNGHPEAGEALKMYRPWGNYESLDKDARYQVKRIVVNPGGTLSLQKHRFRSEHWVVVEGEAEVTLGEEVRVLGPNMSTYIPLGVVHRLANRTDKPVVMIEVQTGSYLGEDDIIRIEDSYNRLQGEALAVPQNKKIQS